MARLNAFASEPHYRAHIEPVAKLLGCDWERRGDSPVIVASYKDYKAVGDRPVIYMEHGSGQTYGSANAAYAGGRDRDKVALFLCPSERIAELNRQAWPHIPAVAIGCPKMDWFHSSLREPERETVGITFHWNAHVCPESRSAVAHYAGALQALARRFTVLGTAHPRIETQVFPLYRKVGIRVTSFDEIADRASVMACDNSSAGWEFLSLDRPVVWMNAPWYRRDVEHGMRFWEWADTGLQVDEPGDLGDALAESLVRDSCRSRRREVLPWLYQTRAGDAAELAAAAIVRHIGG